MSDTSLRARLGRLFATNVVVGMGAVKAYMTAFNEENQNNAKKKAAVLLKQERIMKEIDRTALEE